MSGLRQKHTHGQRMGHGLLHAFGIYIYIYMFSCWNHIEIIWYTNKRARRRQFRIHFGLAYILNRILLLLLLPPLCVCCCVTFVCVCNIPPLMLRRNVSECNDGIGKVRLLGHFFIVSTASGYFSAAAALPFLHLLLFLFLFFSFLLLLLQLF